MGGIVHVVNSDFGRGFNLAVHSWKIAEGMRDKTELTVFCRSATGDARRTYDIRTPGLGRIAGRFLKALHLHVSRKIPHRRIEAFFFKAGVKKALRKLSGTRISVVHTWSSIPRHLASLKRENPSALMIRDYTMAAGSSEKDRASIREELSVFDYFFSPSELVSESLEAAGVPRERIVLIPYGADPEEFKPLPQTEGRKDFRVAFSGLICARKGIPTLLEAWKRLRLPEAVLNLYGRVDPEMTETLREAATHNVVTHGFVDLKSELPRNDLFVFPSLWEGSAKAVYEALASGLPVITTRTAGSVVEDGVQGFIVPALDSSALAAKILYFYENREELLRFSSEARKQGQKFSWNRYARTVIECYRALPPVVIDPPELPAGL